MRVLGVDPGLQVTGYGVIDFSGKKPELVEAGVVRSRARDTIGNRLKSIHNGIADVIEDVKPQAIAIEKLYAHYDHPATAILMGHARGVVCLLSGIHGIPLVDLASTHVKKAVTGNGHASKNQVQRMVQEILGLKKAPEPADVGDALAVALAYGATLRDPR